MDNKRNDYYEYIEEAFEFFDTDKDGYINLSELADTLGAVGLNCKLEVLKDYMKNKQYINFVDFRNLCIEELNKKNETEDLYDIIRACDINGDKIICGDDLKKFFTAIYKKYYDNDIEWNDDLEEQIDLFFKNAKKKEEGMTYDELVYYIKSNK